MLYPLSYERAMSLYRLRGTGGGSSGLFVHASLAGTDDARREKEGLIPVVMFSAPLAMNPQGRVKFTRTRNAARLALLNVTPR